MSITAVEDALLAWVKLASGLDAEHAFFSNQKVQRPSGPYVTVHITSVRALGTSDGLETNYDAGRATGSEIELQVTGQREVAASIQAYNCSTTGSSSAIELIAKIQLAATLPSVQDALEAGGVALFDFGDARDLSALLGTDFDGRAVLDVRTYVRLTISEFTTWIERLEGTALGVPYALEAP